ncbi:hypothetical protein Dimus_004497 [Dionaea muscipula]
MAVSEPGKLFVGGIGWRTSEDTLKEYFSKYGEVLSSVIAKDRCSGTPRGFGFIIFTDPSCAGKALEDQKHVIEGRKVDVKRAIPRSENLQSSEKHVDHNQTIEDNNRGIGINKNSGGDGENQFGTKKLFVGGLKADLTIEEFKNYFERFGRIEDVVVMHDGATNRSRGFGFITFESEEVVETIMQNSFHQVGGKVVEVKRAVPKEFIRISHNNDLNHGGGSRKVTSHGVYSKGKCCYGKYHACRDGLSFPMYGGVDGLHYGAYSCGHRYQMGVYSSIMPYVVPQTTPWNPWWYFPMYGTQFPVYDANACYHPTSTGTGSAESRSSGKYDWDVGSDGDLLDNTGLDSKYDPSVYMGSNEKLDQDIRSDTDDGSLDKTNLEVDLE